MKKVNKILIALMILMLIISISFSATTYAHNVEIDPDSPISFPWMIFGGSGTITIKTTETNYKLYYQAVEISDEDYKKMNELQETSKKELATFKTEIENLSAEVSNLATQYSEKIKEYNNATTDTEKEALKKACEELKEKYDAKKAEYDAKVKQGKEKAEVVEKEIKDLIPGYVEGNWIQTTDNKFNVDLSKFTGEKVFVVWAKLDSNGKISYNESIYTMTGNKSKDVAITAVSLNESEVTIKEGSNYILTATITPADATNKNVEWSSDNEKVATVENGKVTAISEGTATITAKTKDGDFTATCKVTVSKEDVTDTKDEEKKLEDSTQAKTSIPQTGTSYVIVGVIGVLAIICALLYKKNKFLKF